ncbi:HNH endonuclease [Pararhodobacter sp.]|uniref:HNH endonuclease n=1 Tax=Pararhodobacter sp. TaxID=2127056 RepID=UPI002FDD8917
MVVMPRAVEQWIGKTDDTPPPPRVKERILRAFGGRCAITGREFRPGDVIEFDHIIPLAIGGQNAEANLQPVTSEGHAQKTPHDLRAKAKASRVFKKRWGLAGPKRIIPGSKASRMKKRIDGSVEFR